MWRTRCEGEEKAVAYGETVVTDIIITSGEMISGILNAPNNDQY
jgi:hypothetical protein